MHGKKRKPDQKPPSSNDIRNCVGAQQRIVENNRIMETTVGKMIKTCIIVID